MEQIIKKTSRNSRGSITEVMESSSLSSEHAPPVLRYGVGFDVHKATIATCVKAQTPTGEIVEIRSHVFQCNPDGLNELVAFLRKFRPVSHYLMECTGVYHYPLYYKLQAAFPDQISQITAMNPLLVHRRIADLGRKTDKADAGNLASLAFYDELIRPSYIGSIYYMQLREMMRSYHHALTQCTRLKNRIHRTLHAVNQQFPFQLDYEWCLQLLERYISQQWTLSEAFSALLKEQIEANITPTLLKKHIGDILTFGSIALTAEQCFLIQVDLTRLLQEEQVAAVYMKTVEDHILADPDFNWAYQALLSIPAIGSLTALTILVECGDYSRFTSWAAFIKYCGLIPCIYETGEYKAKGHINRYSNAILRYSLCQAAGVLINRSKEDSDLVQFAHKQAIQRGLPFKKAVIKVAQKLARTIYNVLITGITYDSIHETQSRRLQMQQRRLEQNQSLIESARLRALKRDIQGFITTNSELFNSTSRYHIVAGFDRILRKARHLDDSNEKK